ncbi:MAG: hypothetical protein FWE57_02395 [Chitinispirillia bacterium]|nr:hypothetical protein [Chitinispirillia bacterium]
MQKTVTRNFDRENFHPQTFFNEISIQIQQCCEDRKVFLLVSGGVDSTVVFALLNKILGPHRVLGLHVDTGLMRLDESAAVLDYMKNHGFHNLKIEDASQEFLNALDGVYDPEKKREIIGRLYIDIKEKVSEKLELNIDEWVLAQGTIYPDILETAAKDSGDKGAQKVKTHHNRVDAIMELIEKGLIVEPVAQLYKDEVRSLGEFLGLPKELVWRHPFPGPGLGVRCLCSDGNFSGISAADTDKLKSIAKQAGYESCILPLRSVGVKNGARTYAHPAVVRGLCDWSLLEKLSADITNSIPTVNRVVYALDDNAPHSYKLTKCHITKERLDKLRAVDSIAADTLRQSGEYDDIWQMPVVLLPVVNERGGECVVLRPITSKDALTAKFVPLKPQTLQIIAEKSSRVDGTGDLFFDITNKPPGTIEWE